MKNLKKSTSCPNIKANCLPKNHKINNKRQSHSQPRKLENLSNGVSKSLSRLTTAKNEPNVRQETPKIEKRKSFKNAWRTMKQKVLAKMMK